MVHTRPPNGHHSYLRVYMTVTPRCVSQHRSGVKCLLPGGSITFNIGVCWRSLANQKMEITMSHFGHVTGYIVTAWKFWSLLPTAPTCAQWIPSLLTLQEAPSWQAISNRRWHEASCFLLITDTWHGFLSGQDICLGATVGYILQCEWWLGGGLMCTIYYWCAMCTAKS
jgi:hypothetical protein